jgi:uncharacterized membrane protein YjjP (DUF1212 family)
MEARVAVLERIAKETRDPLVRLDRRFDDVDRRFEKRFDDVDSRLDRLQERPSSDFRWVVLFALGALSFMFATMAHGFHWF